MNVLIADLDVICNEELELLQTGAERVHALYSDVKRQLPLSAVRIIAQWASKGILYLDSFGDPFNQDREGLIRKLIFLAGHYANNGNRVEIISEDRLMRELGKEFMPLAGYATGPYMVFGSCTLAKSLYEMEPVL